jgi:hypothetical protein
MRIKFYLKCTINERLPASSAFDEACIKSKTADTAAIFFNGLRQKNEKNPARIALILW